MNLCTATCRSVKSKANFTSLRGQPSALNYDSAPVRPVSARTLKNSLSLDSGKLQPRFPRPLLYKTQPLAASDGAGLAAAQSHWLLLCTDQFTGKLQ